ncbi:MULTISPECIES: YugN family protein [unclassified Paenibacillus]|uniref:YugN family protein n=1 Tax=unclassified Paenibacillus TaxID=185978 RepID=UPI002F40B8A2
MIIENSGLNGIQTELHHLDASTEKAGFVRWQWDYFRATYDLKLSDRASGSDYYLRINARAIEGKLENPHAVLEIEHVYIGRATFPHGLEYESLVPGHIMDTVKQRLQQLAKALS